MLALGGGSNGNAPRRSSVSAVLVCGYRPPQAVAPARAGARPVPARTGTGRTPAGRLLLFADARRKVEPDELIRLDARASAKRDRKSTRLNSSHVRISYAVFCLKKKKKYKNIKA